MDECCIYLQDNLFNDHYVPHSFFFIFFSLYLLLLFLLFSFIFPASATVSHMHGTMCQFFSLSVYTSRVSLSRIFTFLHSLCPFSSFPFFLLLCYCFFIPIALLFLEFFLHFYFHFLRFFEPFISFNP
jgi:hypothetical protein